MIVSRTPLRISFAGGGTDLPSYYHSRPGCVLSTSINKYIYVTINEKFDHRLRVSYSRTELVDHADEVQHNLVREALRMTGIEGGVEITSISDIPSEGSGLGSSSCYTVGILKALYAYKGMHVGAERLAAEACQIEIDILGEPIGKQDQYACAYGGLTFYTFNSDDSVSAEPVIVRPDVRKALSGRLLMFYTGITRSASNILATQSKNSSSEGDARARLDKLVQQAHDLRIALHEGRVDVLGELLHDGWMAKKGLAPGITTPEIDDMYERGRAAGAIGGKILGAGGGGFMLFYAHEQYHEAIKQSLSHCRQVDFSLEPQGSRIIFVE